MIVEIFVLLAIFQIKHLIADYYLQFPYMYQNKGKPDIEDWWKPLFDHATVHMFFTTIIIFFYAVFFNRHAFVILPFVMLFDFVTHFVTDRWKATRKGGPDTAEFWTRLGIDQMVHHIVGIIIVIGVVLCSQ